MALLKQSRHSIYLLALLLFLPGSASHAATQALALLETGGATPLHCQDGICKAEFSTFCLQKERALPKAHAPYTVATGSQLDLILTAADGNVTRVAAGDHVRIRTARAGHTAVVMEISQSALRRLGAQHAAIDVGEKATLMPVPVYGDDNPQTEQDKQLATGPLRSLGARLVDRSPDAIATVRTLNRLVNGLTPDIDISDGARQRLWRRAVSQSFASAPAEEISKAAREYESCWNDRAVALGGIPVRFCLELRHDGLMWQNVKRYWDKVGAGS